MMFILFVIDWKMLFRVLLLVLMLLFMWSCRIRLSIVVCWWFDLFIYGYNLVRVFML